MKVVNDAFRIVPRPETESWEESRSSAEEQRGLSSDDPSGLIDMLKDIDGLKEEIHERIRRLEAVRQAKAVLMEDAARNDMLSRRLAELGRGIATGHLTSPAIEDGSHNPPLLRAPGGPAFAATDHRASPANMIAIAGPADASALPWRRSEDTEITSNGSQEAPMAYDAYPSSSLREDSRIREEANLAFASFAQRMEQAELFCKQCEQAALEARRLLDESAGHLEGAARKEHQATADLRAAQEAFAASQLLANQRIEEAEQCWKQVNEAAEAVRERVERANAELVEARARQETAAADLLSARQDLTTSYQFAAVAAQRRLESSQFFQKASRWAIVATAISWALIAWFAWLTFRHIVPIWAPAVVTVLILVITLRMRGKEVEES
jgi:hypothetical protein